MGKKEKKKNGASPVRRRIRNDIILIASLLILISLTALALLLFSKQGDKVVVSVDGKLYGEYPLNRDQTVEIRNGDNRNLLIIEGGRAYVMEASCPDGICSSHRPVKRDGESIICLPNKVVIEIRTADEDQPDVVT